MSFRMFKCFYVIFCLGLLALFVMSLGQYAAAAFKDGWWTFTKDVASIVGSLAFPWAVWLYFKQRKTDHDERKVKQLLELMEELTAVLVPAKLLANQVVIGSLLHRINSKRMEVDKMNRQEFDFSLRTHVNQLFKNIESCHLISNYSEIAAVYLNSSTNLDDLDEKYREDVLWLAKCIVNSRSFNVVDLGSFKQVSFDKGFSAGLLLRLFIIAQPNLERTLNDSDKLKDLFLFPSAIPFTILAYVYLAFSETGKNIIIDLSSEA